MGRNLGRSLKVEGRGTHRARGRTQKRHPLAKWAGAGGVVAGASEHENTYVSGCEMFAPMKETVCMLLSPGPVKLGRFGPILKPAATLPLLFPVSVAFVSCPLRPGREHRAQQ